MMLQRSDTSHSWKTKNLANQNCQIESWAMVSDEPVLKLDEKPENPEPSPVLAND
jgi:hypothetical protein